MDLAAAHLKHDVADLRVVQHGLELEGESGEVLRRRRARDSRWRERDFADAVEAIVEASRLPLSVLVAGVGDGNFGRLAQMNEGDDGLAVDSQGRAAVRDICRFVPLRAVGSNASALSVSETPPSH